MIDEPTKQSSSFFSILRWRQDNLSNVYRLPSRARSLAWLRSAAVRFSFSFFFSSRRKRPALIGPFDTSKRKMSAAFDRCDWQSVLVKSKNLLSKHLLDQVKRRLSCFSCVPAVYFKMASRNGSLTHVPLNPSPAISLRHSSSSPPSIRARLAPAPQASQPLSFSISRILDLEDDSIQRQTDPPLGKYSC